MNTFLIGPTDEGIRRDVKPFATPENSFETLTNAYQWRGRVVKRSGYTLLGRLANGTPVMGLRTREEFNIGVQDLIAFDTTTAYVYDGAAFVVLPSVMPVIWSGTDSQFFYSINYANALWVTNSKPGLNGYAVTVFAGEAGAGPYTVNVTAPGNNFLVGDRVYFLNVTGPPADNNLRQAIVTVAGDPTFTVMSTDDNALGPFINGVAASGVVLSTMRQKTGQDGIRFYGTLTNGDGWANYNPPVDPNNALVGALLIFAYRGYLVFLNTTEGNELNTYNYGNRTRWTQIGTPYYQEPVPQSPNIEGIDPLTARDDLFGHGQALDAPTNEVIVGGGFIRDTLIVYFERSSWRLRFVNNAQLPFVWERINTEFGSDSTFSTIIFDKGLMAIGNRGIIISDGNDTIRFDEKIPDEIFNIREANNGLQRVYGIRTFRTKLNFWAVPSADNPDGIYPDQVIVFNYETRTWSIFDDCFTCFGYFYATGSGYTWGDLPNDWSSYTNISWNSGVSQGGYEDIVAGNQQGYVFKLEQTDGQNSPSLSISAIAENIFFSINNNLKIGDWITLSGITGSTSDDSVSLNGRNFKVESTGINGYAITLFSGAAGAGPYTVDVTAAGNNFLVGDNVYFTTLTGPGSINSSRTGIVTVAGSPTFTIQNTDSNTLGPFINGAITSGLVISTDQDNANTFTLNEFKPIDGGIATGISYIYVIGYKNILPGSIQINIGAAVFKDINLDGVLFGGAAGAGTISYSTGAIFILFTAPIAPTEVWIRSVTLDPLQGLSIVNTIGAYTGGGEIAKISNIDIRTKFFNFFKDNQKARLSRIDFYTDLTSQGQFTANVFGDSSNVPINTPLSDNPFSNTVLTTANPYQIGDGEEAIFRLYCESVAQTIQLQLTYSDQQLAINAYNRADIEILAMMFLMRKGGRQI